MSSFSTTASRKFHRKISEVSKKANDQLLINELDQALVDQQELHDKWFEKSNAKMKAKHYQQEKNKIAEEMKMVAKASILVRRRALTLRLEADRKQYEEELAQMGKAFQIQRV